jgi:hypothetical protein
MRAEPDKLKGHIIRLAVNQNEVGSDVAVAVIAPLAAERVIEIPSRQWLALRQDGNGFEKQGIEALGPPSGFLAPVITAKAVYLTIRIQAREQLPRRAYGRKLATPRGLHRLDSLLIGHQRLKRQRLLLSDLDHHQAEGVRHGEAHCLQHGSGFVLGLLVDTRAHDRIGGHGLSPSGYNVAQQSEK